MSALTTLPFNSLFLSSSIARYWRFSESVPEVSPTLMMFTAKSPKTCLYFPILFDKNCPLETSYATSSNILLTPPFDCFFSALMDCTTGIPAFTRSESLFAKSAWSRKLSLVVNAEKDLAFDDFFFSVVSFLFMNYPKNLFDCCYSFKRLGKAILHHGFHSCILRKFLYLI